MFFFYTFRLPLHVLLGRLKQITVKQPAEGGRPYYDVELRCWPVDVDVFMHLNNSAYLRCAELSRWRAITEMGIFWQTFRNGWLFLIAEQRITYRRPIDPFQRYIIRTEAHAKDDKWIHYTHRFLQHPDDVAPGATPTLFAQIEMKSVVKSRQGEVIKPKDLIAFSDFSKQLIVSEADADKA
eukprot:EG_transcript_20282